MRVYLSGVRGEEGLGWEGGSDFSVWVKSCRSSDEARNVTASARAAINGEILWGRSSFYLTVMPLCAPTAPANRAAPNAALPSPPPNPLPCPKINVKRNLPDKFYNRHSLPDLVKYPHLLGGIWFP